MATICKCGSKQGNTGFIESYIPKVAVNGFIVPLLADDGTENKIDLTATLNKAFFDALINDVDASKRFYPIGDLDNVEDVRAEPITEGFNSGKNIIIQDGIRTFTGLRNNVSAAWQKKIEAFRCGKFGFMPIDSCGALIGDTSDAGFLKPLKVNNDTLNVMLVKATDTTAQKVSINFEYNRLIKDSNIGVILSEDMADHDLTSASGLLDVFGGTPSGLSTTGFTIELNTAFGSSVDPVNVIGLLTADFELFNETTSSVVTVTSLTESPDGTYAFGFAAQTTADELELRILKDGFDDTELKKVAITIP